MAATTLPGDAISSKRAAALLNVSSVYLSHLARAGVVPHVETVLGRLYSEAEIRRLAAEREQLKAAA